MTDDPWRSSAPVPKPTDPAYGWNEPPAPYSGQQSPPPGPSGSDELGWRIRHSAWILAPLLGLGLFCCIGFIYCAIRIRSARWVVLATVAVLASAVGWLMCATWTTSDGYLTEGATGYILGLWAASAVFALLVAPDYLRWRSERPDVRRGR